MVGSAKASEILMTGRTVTAKEADRIGLASCLAGEGELMDRALETAHTLLGKTPFGLRMTKEAIRTIQAIIRLGPDNVRGYEQLLAQLKAQ